MLKFLKKKALPLSNDILPDKRATPSIKQSIKIKHADIQSDILDLLWIKDGKFKNSDVLKIQNNILHGSIYVGSTPINQEPSLLSTKTKVEEPRNLYSIEKTSYYPSFLSLSPTQKWIYLKFLENPFSPISDVGYLFIFYYGLERYLLTEKYEKAFKTILKLRDIHTNRSFQMYSGTALILTSMLYNRNDLAMEFINSIDKEFEFSIPPTLFIFCKALLNIPLFPTDILRFHRYFGFNNNRYIKSQSSLFLDCLTNVVMEKYGNPEIEITYLLLSINSMEKEECPVFANLSLSHKGTVKIPKMNSYQPFVKEIFSLLSMAHERVKQILANERKSKTSILKSSQERYEK